MIIFDMYLPTGYHKVTGHGKDASQVSPITAQASGNQPWYFCLNGKHPSCQNTLVRQYSKSIDAAAILSYDQFYH